MSDQRDELAAVIASARVEIWGENESEPCEQDYELASEIIASDVFKPRTITTVEELDKLPVGSKVVSAGYEWTKNYQTSHTPGYEAEREVWFNVYDDFDTSEDLALPATVLFTPGADQ